MRQVAFLFVIALLILGCRKDPSTLIEEPCPDVINNSSSSIIIGDTTGMRVVVVNDKLGIPTTGVLTNLYTNPDRDSIVIQVYCNENEIVMHKPVFGGSSGMAYYNRLQFGSAQGFQFHKTPDLDTVYHYIEDTVIVGNSVERHINHHYTCNYESNASVWSISDRMNYLSVGSTISKSDYYGIGATLISPSWVKQDSFVTTPDTNYSYAQFHDQTCFNMPVNEMKYVGFKGELQGVEKLGWIKVLRDDSETDYAFDDERIFIYEVAIQK